MPRVKSINFVVRCEDGTDYRFLSEVSVNADGLFHVTYPEEIDSSINHLISQSREFMSALRPDEKSAFAPIGLETLRVNKRAYGPVLAHIEALIYKAMSLHMQCEVRRELVILYSLDYKYAFAKGSDGSFGANGSHIKDYQWAGNLHATQGSNHYHVGLAAFARVKVSYIRPTGTKVQYETLYAGDWTKERVEYPYPAHQLNEFAGLHFCDPYGKWRDSAVSYTEIPYSDEAAEFFYGALLSVASLADRLREFFGDTERVQLAIANSASAPGLLAVAGPTR